MKIAALCLGLLLLCSACTESRDEHSMTALMHAADAGDAVEVRQLLARGARVNARVIPHSSLRQFIAFISWMQELPHRDGGWTPLFYASRGGYAEVMKLLIEAGADVNVVTEERETALQVASWAGRYEPVDLLLRSGAKPDLPDGRPLWAACQWANAALVRRLLDAGADTNGIGGAQPPIFVAIEVADVETVKALVEHGANLEVRDRPSGWTPLQRATQAGRERIVAVLRAAGSTDDGAADLALLQAVHTRDVAGVRAALKEGAKARAKSREGEPALVIAARFGDLESVRALLAAGADVNERGPARGAPILGPAMNGHVDVARLLLDSGADPDVEDRTNGSPISLAAQFGHLEIVELLLAKGVDVKKRNRGALALATHRGDREMARALLGAGADVNAGGGGPLRAAAWQGHCDLVRELLAAGADANLEGESRMTALQRAAGMGHAECVRLLLGAGAKVDRVDESGNTALLFAAVGGYLETVRLLLAAGADPNRRDSDGKTILQHAAQLKHPDVAEALRQAGAKS